MNRQTMACKCGAFDGWYEKMVSYYIQYRDRNGRGWNAQDENTTGGKRKYCVRCDRDITKIIEDSGHGKGRT